MNAVAEKLTTSESWDDRLEALRAELGAVRDEQTEVSALIGQAAALGKTGKEVTELQTRRERLKSKAADLQAAIEYAGEQRELAADEEADQARQERNRRVEELGRKRAAVAERMDAAMVQLRRDALELQELGLEIRNKVAAIKPAEHDPLSQIIQMDRFGEQLLRTLRDALPPTLRLSWREWDPANWLRTESAAHTAFIEERSHDA